MTTALPPRVRLSRTKGYRLQAAHPAAAPAAAGAGDDPTTPVPHAEPHPPGPEARTTPVRRQMPLPSTSIHVDLPAGGYAVRPDPHEPWRVTYWRIGLLHDLTPYPAGSTGYGPQLGDLTDLDADARRLLRREHRVRTRAYRQRVADAITRDPRAAIALFTALVGYCPRCKQYVRGEDVPQSLGGAAAMSEDPADALARRALELAAGSPRRAARLLSAACTKTLAEPQ